MLHNWEVVNTLKQWQDWIETYPEGDLLDVFATYSPPKDFLKGYRLLVTGFPIVQAVIEQIGIVVACVLLVHIVVKNKAFLTEKD